MDGKALRNWAETWARAGREIDALRRRELAALSPEDAGRVALDILSIPLQPDLPSRGESGLVEQQRLFARVRGGR